MLTEEEARTKWCPFARVAIYVRGDDPMREKPVDLVGHGANRMVVDDPELNANVQAAIKGSGGTKCIASECMAWRRLDSQSGSGYCGLAQKPYP